MKYLIGFIFVRVGLVVANVLHSINHISAWGLEDDAPCPNCQERELDAYL